MSFNQISDDILSSVLLPNLTAEDLVSVSLTDKKTYNLISQTRELQELILAKRREFEFYQERRPFKVGSFFEARTFDIPFFEN